MAEARYLIRYEFAMKKLLEYRENQNQAFIGLHILSDQLLKEGKHGAWTDRNSDILGQVQLNIGWVIQKIQELERLQGYNRFRSLQLHALLKDGEVKMRLGNV